jgi:hypothetical protein
LGELGFNWGLILASLPSVRVQGPKASDRTQVEAKEVRLPDMPPITLDDTDVQTVSFPPLRPDISSCIYLV